MFIWANDFHAIFWVAVIPAVLSILLLGFGLQEPKSAIAHKRSNPLKRENLKKLSAAYWWVVAIGSIFTLARFSEAFLVLRAQQMEIPLYTIPLVMVAMNLVYSLTAYPFGKLSDSMSHSKLLQWGLLVLILADIVLALSKPLEHAADRRRAVGDSYGNDPGPAGGDGRPYGATGATRHGVRYV